MMSNEDYQDRILTCRDCGQDFTFTAGEQAFFASKGLTNAPSRCPSCRAARRGGTSNFTPRTPRESYEAVCANCGRQTTVPFMPTEGRAVYCSDCFQAVRPSRSRRDDSRNNYTSGNYSSDSYGSSSYGGSNNYNSSRRGRDRSDRRDRYRQDDDRW